MGLNVESITFDCADPDAMAHWWATAVGGTVNPVAPGEFVLVGQSDGPNLAFQRVADPTPGKNKLHIDFSAADMDAEVARLVEMGATETGRHNFGDDFHWVVLTDPGGNAFCVAAVG
ncbi:VOC family protein [Mycobacterium sp. IDR2000157661]|uniref:VOC family protein n=1 Tax=Mycobacterium sp. IDR2000157661 TaxID=2867005 RepID=UPI001EED09F3|nr:VOC family protein [Mycobacterium sp. IDR2000157661]ULE35271.1 VOC family protein [Mycobacterium sp. IDR2000157661]